MSSQYTYSQMAENQYVNFRGGNRPEFARYEVVKDKFNFYGLINSGDRYLYGYFKTPNRPIITSHSKIVPVLRYEKVNFKGTPQLFQTENSTSYAI